MAVEANLVVGCTIGEAARRSGCRPSALRYYESVGILTDVPRLNGQRRYRREHLERIGLILSARSLGFSMRELARLVDGFAPQTPASARWSELAGGKIAEIDSLVEELEERRERLLRLADCACPDLESCGRQLSA